MSVVLLGFLFSLVLATSVFAQSEGVFQRVFDILIRIFSLDYLDEERKLLAFLRGVIWIGVFTVLYTVINRLKGMFTGRTSTVLAGVIATLSVIGLPDRVIKSIAGGYSTLAGIVIVGILGISVWHLAYQVLPKLGIQGSLLSIGRIVALSFALFAIGFTSGLIADWVGILVPLVPGLFPRPGFSGRRNCSKVRL